jgi:hypothetical protein
MLGTQFMLPYGSLNHNIKDSPPLYGPKSDDETIIVLSLYFWTKKLP